MSGRGTGRQENDFRFRLGTIPGDARSFFAPSLEAESILAERRDLLRDDPGRFAALLPEGHGAAIEFQQWLAAGSELASDTASSSGLDLVREIGRQWEPDFVLLSPAHTGFVATGGCVCFPSSWALTEKLGLSVARIHDIVPGLNEVLERPIDQLLLHLKPGRCVCRSNWGVSGSPERNQHLDRNLPALELPIRVAQAWLRIEEQCLFVLPVSRAIVFGIRVVQHRWDTVREDIRLARSIARELRTMPPELRRYKRLENVFEALARLLDPDPNDALPGGDAKSPIDSNPAES